MFSRKHEVLIITNRHPIDIRMDQLQTVSSKRLCMHAKNRNEDDENNRGDTEGMLCEATTLNESQPKWGLKNGLRIQRRKKAT